MNFFKTLIATILGIFLSLGLILIILLVTISSSSQEPEPYVRDNTVLKIGLRGSLPAKTSTNPLDKVLGEDTNNKVSLETLKENLTKAQAHENIKGVWLEIDFVSGAWANLQEAHRLISAFRDSSDKFIYASTNDIGYNEKGYFLATAADSIFSPPETFFEFDGFYSQVMFYDGLFEKLGIEAEVTRHGKYKGAVEPYYRKEMSEENEYQLTQLLNQVNSTFVSAVSQKSGRSVEELNTLMNGQPHLDSHFARKEGLIDSLMYADQLEELIKQRIGLEDDTDFKTISNKRYARVSASSSGMESSSPSDKIAVIYANGPIMPDTNSDSPLSNRQIITGTFFEEQLEKIRNDEDVKALVIRVNSPGGAGSTSDLIWRKLQNMKEKMPVIVSMGGVAASGGYYISMGADSIVAEPTTITGSIGVFATKLNTKQLFNEKLGLTFDAVKTHEHADWLAQNRGLTPPEAKALQQYVDTFYQAFITKVADSRGMTVEQVDGLAQGRVWTGADAQENGLVDVLGGFDKAVTIAAEKAELSDYSLEKYPKPKSFYELVMSSANTKAQAWLNNSWFSLTELQGIKQNISLLRQRHALTLFPFEINIQ
ncbi:signal peptide peptidase SppA [Fodinibius salsisoli]|uniref:Signal peptide peptidase SppA n=1 Tax=Fodinibius salsisoli TaxID=2820877 RepID=A0ABT3PJ21_9BACT|nr:signal peptide peptidase SppA [Fodinibius salsisoli]MCW9705937.1 signal peptide peptidase SppA [Fodinibius salsisoli]